jgi:hypothetical protein
VEFDTAVARVESENDDERASTMFTVVERDPDTDEVLDRVECRAYLPEEGQLVILMADVKGRRAHTEDKIAGMVDFVFDLLDAESKDYLTERLLDIKDPFGFAQVADIATGLIEEWSGRPTQQPSDYLPSRKTGGRKSTPRTSKSTSSGSRRTASSTRSTASASAT